MDGVGFGWSQARALPFGRWPLQALKYMQVGSDLAPKFYPVLSSPWPLDLPGWAVGATGAGAEPSA